MVESLGKKEGVFVKQNGNEKISVFVNTDSLMDGAEEVAEDSFPSISATVLVEKPNCGALDVGVTMEDGDVFIDSVNYYGDNAIGKEWK